MSLINDALKRTKQAQEQNPPPNEGPEFKPIDPQTAKSAKNTKSLLYVMVGCVLVGNALLFLALRNHGEKKPEPAPVQASAKADPAPNQSTTTTPAPELPKTAPAPQPAAAVVPNAAPASAAAPETNAVAPVAPPEPPKPAPLRLQSIVYNPGRSSAMVSGKFVFVGDKVQGFRVTAIDKETVTLVGNGQTNVLSLP